MPDFIVIPNGFDNENIPPEKLQHLHQNRGNPSVMNREASIVGYTRGVEVYRGPYNRITAAKLGAVLPSVTVKIMEEGRIKRRTYGVSQTDPELRIGQPPLKQLILNRCANGLTRDEIFKILFKDLTWFRKDRRTIDWVNERIEELIKENLLLKRPDGKMVTSPLELQGLGKGGYPIERGPYPVLRLIRDLASDAGRISTMELEDAVHGEWGWTESRSGVDFWIKKCLEMRILRKVDDNIFVANEEISTWDQGN